MMIKLLVWTGLLGVLGVSVSFAQTTKPSGPIEPAGCVTADCHATVKDFKVLHGPVNVNACEACHSPVDVQQHTYKLTLPKNELCLTCHQMSHPEGAEVHQPVKDGECLSCHNPHGGTTSRFMRAGGTRELCNQCHQDVIADKKHVHGPVAANACEACHKSHSSVNDKLLVAKPGKELCYTCHKEMGEQMRQVQFVHKAVEGDCADCHDPHASNFTMQIKTDPVDLCTSCHADVKKSAVDAKYKHQPVIEGQACLNCHTSHGSDRADLMKKETVDVCMSCHDKPVQNAAGKTVPAVSEITKADSIKHGPIRDGDCSGCHNTHGSNQSRLLTKAYPAEFYQGFAEEKYELCFTCHEKQLVLQEKTTALTSFRNGEVNLHYLHVNKTDKGRNCRACHETHASNNELHVRDTVPYGSWKMPINFTKTETGGTCAPGCHKELPYDRKEPVKYSDLPTSPTTRK